MTRLISKPDVLQVDSDVFPNGLKPGEVIELSGEEGTGKSQYLIHILANALLPKEWKEVEVGGLEVNVVFIDNAYTFTILRLVTVLEHRLLNAITCRKVDIKKENRGEEMTIADEQDDKLSMELEVCVCQCLDRLLLAQCRSSAQCLLTLRSLESVLPAKSSVRFILIDSLDSFLHQDKFNKTEGQFTHCVNVLGKLVCTHQLVLVASKTLMSNVVNNGVKRHKVCQNEHEYFSAWRHLVNQQRSLSKYCNARDGSVENLFSITESCQNKKTLFTITDTGISYINSANIVLI